jgi:hypothetical protein
MKKLNTGIMVVTSVSLLISSAFAQLSFTPWVRMADFDASYGKNPGSGGFPAALGGRQLLTITTQASSVLKVLSVSSSRIVHELDPDRNLPVAHCETRVQIEAGTVRLNLRNEQGVQADSGTQGLILEGSFVSTDDGVCASPSQFTVHLQHAENVQVLYGSASGGVILAQFRLTGLGMKIEVSGQSARALSDYRFNEVHWNAELTSSITHEPKTLGILELMSEESYLEKKSAPPSVPYGHDFNVDIMR